MEWRYIAMRKPTVKHALQNEYDTHSFCGLWTMYWLGTGKQEEYETNEALPKCRNCMRIIGEGWQPDLRSTQEQ